jgi:hypothetical protein
MPSHSGPMMPHHSGPMIPHLSSPMIPQHSGPLMPQHSMPLLPQHSMSMMPHHSGPMMPQHSGPLATSAMMPQYSGPLTTGSMMPQHSGPLLSSSSPLIIHGSSPLMRNNSNNTTTGSMLSSHSGPLHLPSSMSGSQPPPPSSSSLHNPFSAMEVTTASIAASLGLPPGPGLSLAPNTLSTTQSTGGLRPQTGYAIGHTGPIAHARPPSDSWMHQGGTYPAFSAVPSSGLMNPAISALPAQENAAVNTPTTDPLPG